MLPIILETKKGKVSYYSHFPSHLLIYTAPSTKMEGRHFFTSL